MSNFNESCNYSISSVENIKVLNRQFELIVNAKIVKKR